MKHTLSLFFCFLTIFCFSQQLRKIKDTAQYYYGYEPTKSELKKCLKQQKSNKKKFNKLLIESKKIDYSKLTSTLISDLNNGDFKGDVVLFFFSYGNTQCGSFDENKFICENEFNIINPFYNMKNWKLKDLVLMSKVLNEKIIVPSNKNFGFSISNELFTNKFGELNSTPEFLIGDVYDKEVNENHKFYYLSANENFKNINLQTDYVYNTVTNYSFDTLFLKFRNLPGYKVEITEYINNKLHLKKIYEYYNKEWNMVEAE